MCGIIGYVGKKNAKDIIISGLKALEYRGYDSSGIAYYTKNKIKIVSCSLQYILFSNIIELVM